MHYWTCSLILLITYTLPQSTMSTIKAGYWPSYLNSTFPSSSINFSYFTHVYYAFVQPDPLSFALNLTAFDLQSLPPFVSTVHANHAKAMLSVGGGGSNQTTFANLVSSKNNRDDFVKSAIEVARRFGLDGLDLDWEFPANGGEMNAVGELFVEWRDAIEKEAVESGLPKLLLSSAVYYASSLSLGGVTRSYPTKPMGNSLDWINAMCFDYHGSWNTSVTAAPAALYDPTNTNLTTSHGIESWIQSDIPPHKILMGIPLYGRTWHLKHPSVHGVGAPAVAVGPGENGVMIYNDIVKFVRDKNASVVYDDVVVSAYAYKRRGWIGYDDEKSVKAKVEFAKGKGIGGHFFWALGYDDDNWSLSKSAWNAWES